MEESKNDETLPLHFPSYTDASVFLNQLLEKEHKRILSENKKKPVIFSIKKNPNDDPYCHIYKGLLLNVVNHPAFVSSTKSILVGKNKIPEHTFFINSEGVVIDPTFGQHLIKLGINPEDFRKRNSKLFMKGVFIGKPSDVDGLGINYFPNRIRRD